MRFFCVLVLAGTCLLSAQTVGTASRTVSLKADEIVFELAVKTPWDMPVEQTVALLTPLRITQQDLKSVGTLRGPADILGWQFSFTRPYTALHDLLKQFGAASRQVAEGGYALTYQFYFRAAPKTLDAAKQRALTSLIREARSNASASGKVRSVAIEPTPVNTNLERPAGLFGQPLGLLQYQWSVTVVFEED